MWVAVRAAMVWVFGDDVIKYVLYVVVGLFVVVYLEATAATTAIFAQPFGQWWLAGVGGGAQAVTSQPVAGQPIQDPLPTMAPIPGFNLDRTTIIVTNAMTWLGVRYLWGGCTRNGVDCSCYLQNVLRASGIAGVPRNTNSQIAWTRRVPREQIAATDFLYFDNTCQNCGANPTHVGMALGNGMMIHAGDPVHIESYETPRWRALFNSAGRIP